jgi:hypothetical protein
MGDFFRREAPMAAVTYYVALAFKRSEAMATLLRAIQRKRAALSRRSLWQAHWRGWKDIAEPLRSRGPATRLLATSRTL